MSQKPNTFAPIVTQGKIDAAIRAAHRQRSEAFWAILDVTGKWLARSLNGSSRLLKGPTRELDGRKPQKGEVVPFRLAANG